MIQRNRMKVSGDFVCLLFLMVTTLISGSAQINGVMFQGTAIIHSEKDNPSFGTRNPLDLNAKLDNIMIGKVDSLNCDSIIYINHEMPAEEIDFDIKKGDKLLFFLNSKNITYYPVHTIIGDIDTMSNLERIDAPTNYRCSNPVFWQENKRDWFLLLENTSFDSSLTKMHLKSKIRFLPKKDTFLDSVNASQYISRIAFFLKNNINLSVDIKGNVYSNNKKKTWDSCLKRDRVLKLHDLSMSRVKMIQNILINDYMVDASRIKISKGTIFLNEEGQSASIVLYQKNSIE